MELGHEWALVSREQASCLSCPSSMECQHQAFRTYTCQTSPPVHLRVADSNRCFEYRPKCKSLFKDNVIGLNLIINPLKIIIRAIIINKQKHKTLKILLFYKNWKIFIHQNKLFRLIALAQEFVPLHVPFSKNTTQFEHFRHSFLKLHTIFQNTVNLAWLKYIFEI